MDIELVEPKASSDSCFKLTEVAEQQCDELLFATLKQLWKNYLETPPDCIDAKEHWISLFLFYFQYVDSTLTFNSTWFQRFFNSIPEEICSFLLQHVYDIICKSDLPLSDKFNFLSIEDINDGTVGTVGKDPNSSAENPDTSAKSDETQNPKEQLYEAHNFSQLTLNTPADYSKVIALRNFLTNELGHHLLEFLLKVDIQLIASQKGLCNLCVNLFPNCGWKNTNAQLVAPKKVLEVIGDFQFLQLDKVKKNLCDFKQKTNEASSFEEHGSSSGSPIKNNPCSFFLLEKAYNEFRTSQKTSDEIAYTLAKLLLKFANNECESLLSEQSTSVVLLKFALSKMPNGLAAETSFSHFQTNATIIKCVLLELIEVCLNNIFSNDCNVKIVNFSYVLMTLSEGFPDTLTPQANETLSVLFTNGLVFLIFGVIYNLTVIENRRLQEHQIQSGFNLNGVRSPELTGVSELCKLQIRDIFNNANHSHVNAETCVVYGVIMTVLGKIVENVKKLEQVLLHQNSKTSDVVIGLTELNDDSTHIIRPRRRRFFNLQQMHCTAKVLLNQHALHCFFQGLMLDLQVTLPRGLQEQNLRYWLRSGICCCHYTLPRLGQFLGWIVTQTSIYQRYIYKFLHRKVLNSIFAHSFPEHNIQHGKRRSNSSTLVSQSVTHCGHCDAKLQSLDYHLGLLEQYRQLYLKIAVNVNDKKDFSSFILFLKHLKDIAALLPNDIAVGILAEIVLPIFRQHKSLRSISREKINLEPKGLKHIRPFWLNHDKKSVDCLRESLNRPSSVLRTLFECLNIFITYLNDIRLIKAFYNEENIQHLEDLIAEPELVGSICDLIKIGIDNVTFLGDNPREQDILSKRLIKFQLKSSDRAAQQLNAVFKRLSQFNPKTIKNFPEEGKQQQTTFWLNEKNEATNETEFDDWEAFKHLTTLDVLKNAAQLWALTNDLLRSNQQFYNAHAKAYSIVGMEDSVQAEIEDNEEEPSTPKDDSNTKPYSAKELTSGERNIVDVVRLNYNALSSFLLISSAQKKTNANVTYQQAEILKNDLIYKIQSSQSSNNLSQTSHNKVDDCGVNSLDSLVHSTNSLPIALPFASHDLPTLEFGTDFEEINIGGNFHWYAEAINETFFQRLLNRFGDLTSNESIVLFDIRNCMNMSQQSGELNCATLKRNVDFNSEKFHVNTSITALSPDSTNQTTTHSPEIGIATATMAAAAAVASVQNNESVVGKVFRMFGTLFGLTNFYSDDDLSDQQNQQQSEVDDDLKEFYQPQSNFKRSLLKIFESTMSICLKGYRNEEDEMDKHLRKLKAIILSNAFTHWNQYSEESSRDNVVLQALQVLLQIAELSIMPNEPPSAVEAGGRSTENNFNIAAGNDNVEIVSPMRSRTMSTATSYKRRRSTVVGILAPGTPISPNNGNDCKSQQTAGIYVESDVDLSENDKEHDESSIFDEGYEADGEIPEATESDSGAAEMGTYMWSHIQPTSRYRTFVLHSGLCRLIVSITIELIKKCAENPMGWCDSLAQLVKHLFPIRHSLGGSLFLLQSFLPLLRCSDPRLKELQQTVLDLITELNTPETLFTFFSILTAKAPQIDVLIKYMHSISIYTVRKAQASVELEFPVPIDGRCISTSDRIIAERIDRVRSYHLQCQVLTPLTRAPCIIPITHTRVWTADGFSLSLWIQAKSTVMSQKGSSHTCQTTEDDVRSTSLEDVAKTHVVSIGSSHVLLSVYLNNNYNLTFEVTRPNGTFQTRPILSKLDESNNTFFESKQQQQSSSRPNNPGTVIDTTSPIPMAETGESSAFRNALKQTKLVLLNSFSNIIHGAHESGGGGGGGGGTSSDPYTDIGSSVNLKNYRMQPNKWTHFAIAAEVQQDSLDIAIHFDGLEQHHLSLPCKNIKNLTRTYTFQLMTLGDSATGNRSPNNSINCSESHSSLDCCTVRTSISTLMLFNRPIRGTEYLLNLVAMGPDYVDLTPCQIVDRKPNYGFLNMAKMSKANFGNFKECMRILKESRTLTYSAQQPDLVMCYDVIATTGDHATYGHPCGLMLYGELTQTYLKTLQTATLLCGGLSNLLYLFARVVEATNSAVAQGMALDILLNVAFSDSQLYAEFQHNDYFNLIGYVIKTERCSKDVHLLRSIVNNACSQPVIHKKSSETLFVHENTTAAVVYPNLIVSILHRYSDWQRSGVEHSEVLDMLFECILALTREKHPQRSFNMEQLNRAGLFKALLNLCKVYVIESPNPVFISTIAAERFVEIVSVFAGAPASPSLMDEIMKLLLLLHKPSECYITHDRSKFYFLLSAHPPPVKEKLIGTAVNFSRVAAPFRRSTNRARPGVAVPMTRPTNQKKAADLKSPPRTSRVNRIHDINISPHKQTLRAVEENLLSIANCSKVNKNALRIVIPAIALQWRTICDRVRMLHKNVGSKPKRHMFASSLRSDKQRSFTEKRTARRTVLSPRRLVHHHRRSLKTSIRNKRFSVNADEGSDNASEAQPSDLPSRRLKALIKTDFCRSKGIIALQEGLYKLLKDFLCLLPDNVIDEVLRHYIKMEILLVLANHSSTAVRAAILRLMAELCKRLPQSELMGYSKNYYPQHLANQISIHSTDAQMFEACLEWIYGIYGNVETILGDHDTKRPLQRFGISALLAITAKLTTQQVDYAETAFRLLTKIFHDNTDEQQLLIDNGLLQCCVKALHNLYSKSNIVLVNARTESAILNLLISIGKYALKCVGQMNVIWDILNMLAFFQYNQPSFVIRGFRSLQAQVQLNWINMFFGENGAAQNFKVISFGDSTPFLSWSEIKTRLGLLVDRCCQFFTVFDASYTPTDSEFKLFELLVSYCISTNQRCNNFIAWGLQPSRPQALRALIVDTLWAFCQNDFQSFMICDGKMIKSLLWLSLLEDVDQPFENLKRLCKRLGIDDKNSVWNVENEIQRLELNRFTMSNKQKTLLEKTVYRLESLAIGCIESSMIITRRVAELQNAERKLLMSHMKDYDETATYTKWLEIIRRMTHEGAPWYCPERSEKSWELDDTEGPSRVHTRLRRCHLDIDKRFVMPDYERLTLSEAEELSMLSRSRYSSSSLRSVNEFTRPLEYLISSYDQQLNISLNSQILYNFPAKYLPVDGEIDGEIIITDHKLYFLATYRCKYFYVTCDISNISEIWIKRYQHQEKAFEIFLETNQSLFFSLQNLDDWKIMRDIFCDKIISQPDQAKILSITQQWREGLFTNWEYLMTLNQIAGRTYNDLMQYPVFPWILSNYMDESLDLTNPQNFRKLEKPIAVQNEANEQHYINNYMYIDSTMTNMGSLILKPYHYSSHYSNSGTVLHFLVRVPPFTSYFLRYQDNNFDLPDRTFHALKTTWNLASRDSPTDVKELIPEFFCLPEMFENFERFNFGCRQNGDRVDNVTLPPWCQRDSRLFVLIHRQALECEIVRRGLHKWIDLIFGFKQTGESAVEAINVFHPATYSSFMESEILDPIERRAVETMVKTYGQMPRQLFKAAHPASKGLNYSLVDKTVLPSIPGLRWGVYLGSPQLPPPSLGNIHKLPEAEYLLCFSNTNVVYGLPAKSCVMQGIDTDTYNFVSWGYEDRIVRIQALNKPYTKPKNLLQNNAFDEITVCGADPSCNQLWLGHRSGRITVYKCLNVDSNARSTKGRQSYVRGLRLSYNSAFRKIATSTTTSSPLLDTQLNNSNGSDISGSNIGLTNMTSSATSLNTEHAQQRDTMDSGELSWIGPTVLIRHTDEITAISISVEFKIAVSAGRDGNAVIWDLNDWRYVRTIQRPSEIHHSPISLIAISSTLGDIVTVHTLSGSQQGATSDNSDNEDKCEKQQSTPSNNKTNTTNNPLAADECFEVTEESLDDFVNVCINPNGKSILRLHTVNARYIQHMLQEERILAVCYSYIKEGVGVNVIATALEGGFIRLWSSWNLNFVCEIVTGISDIKSITYSTHQHLVVLTKEAHIQVWETDGLYGSPPKFPQISYK